MLFRRALGHLNGPAIQPQEVRERARTDRCLRIQCPPGLLPGTESSSRLTESMGTGAPHLCPCQLLSLSGLPMAIQPEM